MVPVVNIFPWKNLQIENVTEFLLSGCLQRQEKQQRDNFNKPTSLISSKASVSALSKSAISLVTTFLILSFSL